MSIVISGTNKHFWMVLESNEPVILISSDEALKEAANHHLLIATIEWDWYVDEGIAKILALSGISEEVSLDIEIDLKEEIENNLHIKRNDIIYLAYDFLANTEIYKDDTGYRRQRVTEYVIPRFIINPRTGQAVFLDAGEFENE